MLHESILTELTQNNVQYCIVGGIAVNLHGFSRATGDLDLVLSFNEDNLNQFKKCLITLGYKPDFPVPMDHFFNLQNRELWRKEKNMKAFSFVNPQEPMSRLDILIEEEALYEKIAPNCDKMSFKTLEIPVINIDDLIEMKKKANRTRDKLDVETLEAIKDLEDE